MPFQDYRTTQPPAYNYLLQDMITASTGGDHSKARNKFINSRVIKTEHIFIKQEPVEVNKTTTIKATAIKGSLFPSDSNKSRFVTNNNHHLSPIVPKLEPTSNNNKSRLDINRMSNGQPTAKKLKTSPDKPLDVNRSIPDLTTATSVHAPPVPLRTQPQQHHACFMSLVRSIFCSTPDHRITFDNLQRTVRVWLANDRGTSPWFDDCHSWLDELPSVVKFLVGEFAEQPEDYVPYIEYKTALQIYQWIGAGRDTDQHLLPLQRFWLEHRHEFGRSNMPEGSASHRRAVPHKVHVSQGNKSNTINDPSQDDPLVVPPSRSPTNWIMRPERVDEVALFRVQEKQRYDTPGSPFTYRMHGYEASVGPVLGVYAQVIAKGSNVLTTDRPPGVTITSLVRDAIARLPNGEGTKAHVCELLKASQFIVPGSVLHVVVSNVVERLQKDVDRCVYVDPRRKVLIYTHRAKTEAEFKRPGVGTPTTTYKKVVMAKKVDSSPVDQTSVDQKRVVTSRVVNRSSTSGSLIKMDQIQVMKSSGSNSPVSVLGRPQIHLQPQQQNSVFKIRTSKPGALTTTTTTSPVVVTRNASPAQMNRITAQFTKDIEANLDAKHPPALIPKLTHYAKGAPVKVVTSSNSTTVPQSFQISTGGQPRPMMSLLTTSQGQPVLIHSPRTVKMTTPQSVLISSPSNQQQPHPPALVATTVKQSLVARSSPVAVLPANTRVVRARPSVGGGAVTTAVSVMPKKTITVSPSTITSTAQGQVKMTSVSQKPIQICTSSGNISVMGDKLSPVNGSVMRGAATSLLATQNKPMIQNIVIRSASPQSQQLAKRTVPLKTFTAMVDGSQQQQHSPQMKSILVSNSNSGDHQPNVIKIRTSTGNHLMTQQSNNSSSSGGNNTNVVQKTQFLQIHHGGASVPGQQFILRQGNNSSGQGPTVNLSNASIAVKGGQPLKQGSQLVQLPAKTTLLKGSPVTTRVVKTVQGVSSPGQSMVRTVGGVPGRVITTTTQPGMGQLVTLMDPGGSGKGTPIRIGKAGTTGNMIQLAATTNGSGGGTQYTVLSPGRSVIQVQQQGGKSEGQQRTQIVNAKMMTSTGTGGESVAVKPGIR